VRKRKAAYGFTDHCRQEETLVLLCKGIRVLNFPDWGWGSRAPVLWGFTPCRSPWSGDLQRSCRRSLGKRI